MKILYTSILSFCLLAIAQQANAQTVYATPRLFLQEVANGFVSITDISSAGDGRLFVTEQPGKVWILDSAFNKSATPFMDITGRVHDAGGEQGLLGLVFHPQYKSNGYFFVNYIGGSGNGRTMITRFSVMSGDSSHADVSVEDTILRIQQPAANHNGGDLNFGPDGYLYVGMGDGGGGGDLSNYAQNKKSLLGKMLRVDVNNGLPYTIPPSNPFVGNSDYDPEIWALGMRNPWRHSFDRLTGDYWIADVGQNAWEEVNFEPAGDTGGHNYGWRCYEGNHPFNTGGCDPIETHTFPVFEYEHPGGAGRSITGGYIYRGSDYPGLYGYYISADLLSGNFYLTKQVSPDSFSTISQNGLLGLVSTFGENNEGEMFVANTSSSNSEIYRITDACNGFNFSKNVQVACDGAGGSIELIVAGGTGPLTFSWSTTTTASTINDLTPGGYSVTVTDSLGCVIRDSITILDVTSVKPDITYEEDSLKLTSTQAQTYLWFKDGVEYMIASTVQTGQTTYVSESGDYSVVTRDSNGCVQSSDVLTITITPVKDQKGNIVLSIFPNPTSNLLRLQIMQPVGLKSAEIISVDGKVARTIDLKSVQQGILTIDVSDLAPGVYNIRANFENGSPAVSKIVKL